MNCCGVDSYMDWGQIDLSHVPSGISVNNVTVPFSCCAETQPGMNGEEECYKLYANGCLPRVIYLVYQSAGLLGTGAMTIAFIQVIILL